MPPLIVYDLPKGTPVDPPPVIRPFRQRDAMMIPEKANTAEEQKNVAKDSYKTSSFPGLYGRLSSLSKLQRNWNSYGSEPPNKTALFRARRVLDQLILANFTPSAVKPSPDEGIGVVFISGKKQATIECLNTGSVYLIMSDPPIGYPAISTIVVDHIENAIRSIQTSFQSE